MGLRLDGRATTGGFLMKKLLGGVAVSALLAAPALAADLPARMPVKAPPAPVVAAYSWTGCYIGGNAGGIRGDSDVTLSPSGAFAGDPLNPLRTDSFSFDDTAFTGGGQIGCNWQNNAFVLGIEADIQWSGLDESVTLTRALAAPLVGTVTHSVSHSMDWWGTLRGRVGVAFGATLIYATGGLAFANLDTTASTLFSAAGDLYSGSSSDTRFGWTVGGGLEWGFAQNWSIKAEYLFVDLGSESFLMPNVPPPAFPLNSYTADIDTKFHVARIGLNYRFGAGPVVARY